VGLGVAQMLSEKLESEKEAFWTTWSSKQQTSVFCKQVASLWFKSLHAMLFYSRHLQKSY